MVEYSTVDGENKDSLFLGFLEDNRQQIMDEIFSFLPDDAEIRSKSRASTGVVHGQ